LLQRQVHDRILPLTKVNGYLRDELEALWVYGDGYLARSALLEAVRAAEAAGDNQSARRLLGEYLGRYPFVANWDFSDERNGGLLGALEQWIDLGRTLTPTGDAVGRVLLDREEVALALCRALPEEDQDQRSAVPRRC